MVGMCVAMSSVFLISRNKERLAFIRVTRFWTWVSRRRKRAGRCYGPGEAVGSGPEAEKNVMSVNSVKRRRSVKSAHENREVNGRRADLEQEATGALREVEKREQSFNRRTWNPSSLRATTTESRNTRKTESLTGVPALNLSRV